MNNFLEELSEILFLDIETASLEEDFGSLSPRLQEEWLKKEAQIQDKKEPVEPGDLFFQKAGIYAEFGKVICVGVGFFKFEKEENKLVFRTKSFAATEEYDTLLEFCELLRKKKWILCAHNGKEFDFPYLSRRVLINRIPLPEPLQLSGRKPWEIRHLDTLELWKFGDHKHYTRLELLASVFDIPTSKEGIDGSQVNDTYYIKGDPESIRSYCIRDVVVTAQIYLAFQGVPPEMEIEVVNTDEAE